MKESIASALAEKMEGISKEEFLELIEIPPDEKMGDLAIPCFSLAKKYHKNPALIAEEIKNVLALTSGIIEVKCVGGYCNIFLDRSVAIKMILGKASKENFGVKKVGEGKTMCIDYSSPNIAKNFHVGHLRTTVIGNSINKIYEALGYRVVKINHLGDWGTQFGKLIVAFKKWSSKEEVEEKGIEELLRIYVKFNEEEKAHPEQGLLEEARSWFVKMEQNDEEALQIWKWFKEISMVEFNRVYDLLGMNHFDVSHGESYYRDKVPALAKLLTEKGLLMESQGANVISLDAYDMPPCMITKSDGGSIYHSRDIAAILDRKESYDFEKCIYVTGSEQALHFKQIFKAIELMGYDWYENLVHVPYGLVSLNGLKLSTRGGNIIYAEDILNEAVKRAYDSIEEKNPDLGDKEIIAKQVGIGAVIFHDLFNQRIKNVDFKWEDVLNFEGTTGPYVQYSYVRANGILEKNEYEKEDTSVDLSKLTDDASFALIKMIGKYEDVLLNAANRYEPSVVARYLIDLATAFNHFYHECNIMQTEASEKKARLYLVDLVQKLILEGASLLGMECPMKM